MSCNKNIFYQWNVVVCDKLLNAKATGLEHKQPLPPFVTTPDLKKIYANSDVLTMKMIRII